MAAIEIAEVEFVLISLRDASGGQCNLALIDPRIANPELARAGGDLLAGDVNSLHVTHTGAGSPTSPCCGHSYGSTTVADAFAGTDMQATNAVLLGCPGTDLAQTASDFNLQGGQLYVGNASTDPIGWIGSSDVAADVINGPLADPAGLSVGLGADASAESFGGVRFHAEVPGRSSSTPTTTRTTTRWVASRCTAWRRSRRVTGMRWEIWGCWRGSGHP